VPEVYADVAEAIFYNEDAATPLTVLKPAAFDVGEMLVLGIVCDSGNASALTAPAGWTVGANVLDTPGVERGKIWSHVYSPSDPSTWDFGYEATGSVSAVLLRITHADVTTPVVTVPAPTATSSNAATMDSPSVTPTTGHDLLLCLLASNGNNAAFSYAEPTGMTDLGQTQFGGLYQAVGAAKEQLTAPGGTSVRTWTSISPTGRSAGAFSIAVKDAGLFDPDPPRIPPLPTVSEALLNQLLAAKARRFVGGAGTAWIQEQLFGGASSASVTLTTAAGTKAGDVLYCFHGNNAFTAAGLSTPTGTAGTWTLEATGDNGSGSAHLKLWRRVVSADGPQIVTVAPAVDEEIWSHLFVIGGADPANPTDVAAGSNGAASTSHVAPAVIPTSPYPLLLCGVQGAGIVASYTPPAGMDERTDFNTPPGFGAGSTAQQVLPVTNVSTGTRTFVSTVSQVFASVSVAIRAAGESVAADVRPQAGTSAIGVVGTATAVRVAAVSGQSGAALASTASQVKRAPVAASGAAGAVSSGTVFHAVPVAESGTSAAGVAGRATATKVTGPPARSAIAPVTTATAVKVSVQAARCTVGVATRATAVKKASATGSGGLAVAGSGVDRKVAPQSGIATGAVLGYGTLTSASARAQTGRATIGVASRAGAVKTVSAGARCITGAATRATAVKVAASSARATTGVACRAAGVKVAQPQAAASIGAAARASMTKRATPISSCASGIHGHVTVGHRALPTSSGIVALLGLHSPTNIPGVLTPSSGGPSLVARSARSGLHATESDSTLTAH
jgi:hypothetical protein